MALNITENNGLFEISGSISAQNLGVLHIYFKAVLEKYDILLVSIEGVREMDAAAALYFEKLYKEVAQDNKAIHLFGLENKRISEVMQLTGTSYILSSDRV